MLVCFCPGLSFFQPVTNLTSKDKNRPVHKTSGIGIKTFLLNKLFLVCLFRTDQLKGLVKLILSLGLRVGFYGRHALPAHRG